MAKIQHKSYNQNDSLLYLDTRKNESGIGCMGYVQFEKRPIKPSKTNYLIQKKESITRLL